MQELAKSWENPALLVTPPTGGCGRINVSALKDGKFAQTLTNPIERLYSCGCSVINFRPVYLQRILRFSESYFSHQEPLIYLSLGSGGLWFDWLLLEGLLAQNLR